MVRTVEVRVSVFVPVDGILVDMFLWFDAVVIVVAGLLQIE